MKLIVAPRKDVHAMEAGKTHDLEEDILITSMVWQHATISGGARIDLE